MYAQVTTTKTRITRRKQAALRMVAVNTTQVGIEV